MTSGYTEKEFNGISYWTCDPVFYRKALAESEQMVNPAAFRAGSGFTQDQREAAYTLAKQMCKEAA